MPEFLSLQDVQNRSFTPDSQQHEFTHGPYGDEAQEGYVWVKYNGKIVQMPKEKVKQLQKHGYQSLMDQPLRPSLPDPSDAGKQFEPLEGPASDGFVRTPPTQMIWVKNPDGEMAQVPLVRPQARVEAGLGTIPAQSNLDECVIPLTACPLPAVAVKRTASLAYCVKEGRYCPMFEGYDSKNGVVLCKQSV